VGWLFGASRSSERGRSLRTLKPSLLEMNAPASAREHAAETHQEPIPLADSQPAQDAYPTVSRSARGDTGGLSTLLFIGAILSVIALIFTAAWWAKPRLEQYVQTARGAYPVQVVIKNPGLKVTGVEGLLIRRAAQIALSNPGNDETLNEIRRIMESTGWFEPGVRITRDLERKTVDDGVNQPQKVMVSVITIDGTFRQPMGLVRSGEFSYLIDQRGVRLDSRYPAGTVSVLPEIVGVKSGPPAVGRVWDGRDMEAGLAVIRAFLQTPRAWSSAVKTVDVTNASGGDRLKPRIVLVSQEGYLVAWGRAPGDEAGIDVPMSVKLRMLDDWWKAQKKLGGPQGMLRVDKPLFTIDR